jgi:predicted O-methyltransferase YrrM
MPKNGKYTEEERLLLKQYGGSADYVGSDPSFFDVRAGTHVQSSVEGEVQDGDRVTFSPQGTITRPDRGDRVYDVDPCFPTPAFTTSIRMWGVDEGVADLLTGFVRALKPLTVLEIGTNWGRSARAIAAGLAANKRGHLITVDMVDHQIMETGAIPVDFQEYVTQIIGKTPEVYTSMELNGKLLKGVDMVFLDAKHTAEGMEEDLAFVDKVRSEECVVLADNAREPGWASMEGFFKTFDTHPHINIETMTGTEIILMKGPKGP